MPFADRRQAGQELAAALADRASVRGSDPVVLALPRGGVPVAYEIARKLDAPLAAFVVRKLGVPGYRELAMGAIASGGVRVLNDAVVKDLGIPEQAIERIAEEEGRELERRERLYNGAHPMPNLAGRVVVIVDDGLATGSTMRAAVEALRQHKPARIVVAVPVAAAETCLKLRDEADDVLCLRTPEPFRAVGLWYRIFEQTTDDEVQALLVAAHSRERRELGKG